MSKFSKRAYDTFMSQPAWARGVEIAFGVVVTYFAGRNLVKLIRTKLDQAKYYKTVNEFKDDLNSLSKKGIKPTYPDSQYLAWSNKIQNQFAGCDWGQSIFKVDVPIVGGFSQSGVVLYSILDSLKNNADFAKLVTAYGSRTYDQCGTWPFAGDFTGDLYKAVGDELDEDEIFEINKMLAKKGITYKF